MASNHNRFEWAAFVFLITEILAASILFFVVFAAAVLSDYSLVSFMAWLEFPEDGFIQFIRKSVKYSIIAADAFIVLSFVLRGVMKVVSGKGGGG